MNLGLAIFLSSLLLGIIFLFNSTKDRWNWKRISKFSGIVLLSCILIICIYYFFFLPQNNLPYNKPSKATRYWEIELGASKDDVLFLKGSPDKTDRQESVWIYTKVLYKYYDWKTEYYKIVFNNNIVTSVVYYGTNLSPALLWRRFTNYNLQSLKDYLGEPSDVSSSPDGLRRVYSFSSYNTVFYMEENKVFAYGIYNPEYGTYKF